MTAVGAGAQTGAATFRPACRLRAVSCGSDRSGDEGALVSLATLSRPPQRSRHGFETLNSRFSGVRSFENTTMFQHRFEAKCGWREESAICHLGGDRPCSSGSGLGRMSQIKNPVP